jgi:hypothetical protein
MWCSGGAISEGEDLTNLTEEYFKILELRAVDGVFQNTEPSGSIILCCDCFLKRIGKRYYQNEHYCAIYSNFMSCYLCGLLRTSFEYFPEIQTQYWFIKYRRDRYGGTHTSKVLCFCGPCWATVAAATIFS